MAQFMGTIQGSKGVASRLGGKSSGLRVTCNGWHKGVEVFAAHVNGRDVFKIFATGGSTDNTKRWVATIE